MHKPLPSIETLMSRNAKKFPGIFKSRMKRINSSYNLIEFRSCRRSSADRVVNVATVDFKFGAVVLIEKKIGVQCSLRKDWRSWVPFWYSWPRH